MLHRLMPYAYLISVMVFPVQHRAGFQPCYGTANCNVSSCAEHRPLQCRGFSYRVFLSALSADTEGGTREKAGLGRRVLIWTGERVCPAVKGLLCCYTHHFTLVFLLLCSDTAVSLHFLLSFFLLKWCRISNSKNILWFILYILWFSSTCLKSKLRTNCWISSNKSLGFLKQWNTWDRASTLICTSFICWNCASMCNSGL